MAIYEAWYDTGDSTEDWPASWCWRVDDYPDCFSGPLDIHQNATDKELIVLVAEVLNRFRDEVSVDRSNFHF
jgi:hypothetical protein